MDMYLTIPQSPLLYYHLHQGRKMSTPSHPPRLLTAVARLLVAVVWAVVTLISPPPATVVTAVVPPPSPTSRTAPSALCRPGHRPMTPMKPPTSSPANSLTALHPPSNPATTTFTIHGHLYFIYTQTLPLLWLYLNWPQISCFTIF